jgi:hypothetical protein
MRTLLLPILVCLPVVCAALPANAGATSLTGIGAPVLNVSGQTVQWNPVGVESTYMVAVSNAPREAPGRVTQYLWVERVPGDVQSYTPVLSPGETVYVGVSADAGITWSEEEASVSTPTAPVLSESNGAVHWAPIGGESTYMVAVSNAPREAPGRVTQYLWVERVPGDVQSYTPVLSPGETVYVGVSADAGITWSEEEASVSTPELVLPPSAPVLSVHGDTVSWAAIPGVASYTLATIHNPATTRETTYSVVTSTSITPPTVPGQTISYGLAARTPVEGPWATEQSITYPAEAPTTTPPTTTTPPPTPTPTGKIIGTNDGAGWGPAAAKTILAGNITWNRVEIGSEDNPIAASEQEGFHTLAIVGNIEDNTPLSQIEPNAWAKTVVAQLQANPGITIAEAGNEMYLKGNIANPIQYGRMYLAAVNAMKAAGINKPLLFDMLGDYPTPNWTSPTGESWDSEGGGWLPTAVKNVPGLASAILANGIGTHPYGALHENGTDSYGVEAVAAQESVAKNVLGGIPPIYITEFGYDLSRCGQVDGACSQEEQASKLKAAYEVFLADPHVDGIWVYQSHDDSTGQYGYMNNNNTTRPAFNIISAFATAQGQ